MIWNPWRGCHKVSEGCKYCYIHKGDSKKGIDTNKIVKTDKFDYPIRKNKDGTYKVKSGKMIYLCFSSDFLIEEADEYREECFSIIKERSDLTFLFLTKRIERFMDCIPSDFQDSYDNVIVVCTIENQETADKRLTIFKDLPIKHKMIIAQPLLERINIEKYLEDIELVVVGGESDYHGRVLDYNDVVDIKNQCIRRNTSFEFRQCGTNFKKENILYKLKTYELTKQAKKANINYYSK